MSASLSVRPRRYFRPALETLEDRTTPATLPAGFFETLVNTGGSLSAPTGMAFSPDGRLFVTEQGGTVKVINGGVPSTALQLNVSSEGERGVLGLAFDPDFDNNQFAYVYYTATTPTIHNRISRFTLVGDNFTNEQVVLDLSPLGATNHNGGALHFANDGMLYAAVGENADPSNAQSLGNLLGKMLRINTSGFTGTANDPAIIPSSNPFFNTATGMNRLIWALGLRNPFSFDVQRSTGRIFINDVGQNTWEEIDEGVAGSNYGWPNSEGFRNTSDAPTAIGTYRNPILSYSHTGSPGGIAIVGSAFYDPPTVQFPSSFAGKYFYSDLGGRYIRVFDRSHPGTFFNRDTSTGFAVETDVLPVALAVDTAGSLYYLARGTGTDTGVVKRIGYSTELLTPKLAVGVDRGGLPIVRLFNAVGSFVTQFYAYETTNRAGVRVATGDVTGDGVPDIFTAPGPGGLPFVKIFDGATRQLVRAIRTYGNDVIQGLNLAVGDVDPSPGLEVIVAPDVGGAPYVHVFNASNGQFLRRIIAYAPSVRTGVRVAAGDVDASGGGLEEILTATAFGAPVVHVIGTTGLIRNVQVYPSSFQGGLFLAAGNIDGAGQEEIIVGLGAGGPSIARAFTGTGILVRTYSLFGNLSATGVRVATGLVNDDNAADVILAVGRGTQPYIRVKSGPDGEDIALFRAFDPDVMMGLFVAGLA